MVQCMRNMQYAKCMERFLRREVKIFPLLFNGHVLWDGSVLDYSGNRLTSTPPSWQAKVEGASPGHTVFGRPEAWRVAFLFKNHQHLAHFLFEPKPLVPFAFLFFLRVTFVVGGGKKVRQKYSPCHASISPFCCTPWEETFTCRCCVRSVFIASHSSGLCLSLPWICHAFQRKGACPRPPKVSLRRAAGCRV